MQLYSEFVCPADDVHIFVVTADSDKRRVYAEAIRSSLKEVCVDEEKA